MKNTSTLLLSILVTLCIGMAPQVNAENAIASDRSHDIFDAILKQHVIDGKVNYAGIQKDSRFAEYLSFIKQAQPDSLATDKEKLAFWINTYNALTIKGIIDGLSPKNLFGRYKFFISTKYPAARKLLSLDHIEKKIIIPEFNDVRIHFAIVCASHSCPKLLSEAYTAEKLDQQMNKNAIDFLSNTEKNQFDLNKNQIKISKIFDWFRDDFEAESGSLPEYIANYIDNPGLKDKLLNEKVKIKFLKYNWSLNGIPPA